MKMIYLLFEIWEIRGNILLSLSINMLFLSLNDFHLLTFYAMMKLINGDV